MVRGFPSGVSVFHPYSGRLARHRQRHPLPETALWGAAMKRPPGRVVSGGFSPRLGCGGPSRKVVVLCSAARHGDAGSIPSPSADARPGHSSSPVPTRRWEPAEGNARPVHFPSLFLRDPRRGGCGSSFPPQCAGAPRSRSAVPPLRSRSIFSAERWGPMGLLDPRFPPFMLQCGSRRKGMLVLCTPPSSFPLCSARRVRRDAVSIHMLYPFAMQRGTQGKGAYVALCTYIPFLFLCSVAGI